MLIAPTVIKLVRVMALALIVLGVIVAVERWLRARAARR